MMQLPAEIWNEIAGMPSMRTKWGKTIFPLSQETLTEVMEEQARRLAESGVENKVILAYQTFLPILAEREAISE